MAAPKRKISWKKRLLSLLLAVSMISGNMTQQVYASQEGGDTEASSGQSETKGQKVIRISEKDIEKILKKDLERRPQVKVSDIPLKGDAKKQSVLDELLSMTEDKTLIKKVKDGDTVCFVYVEKTGPDFAYMDDEDGEGEEEALMDYLDIITINGGSGEVRFRVELDSATLSLTEATQTEFRIVGENEDFIVATPSDAQKATPSDAQKATPSEADKNDASGEDVPKATPSDAEKGDTGLPENGPGETQGEGQTKPEDGTQNPSQDPNQDPSQDPNQNPSQDPNQDPTQNPTQDQAMDQTQTAPGPQDHPEAAAPQEPAAEAPAGSQPEATPEKEEVTKAPEARKEEKEETEKREPEEKERSGDKASGEKSEDTGDNQEGQKTASISVHQVYRVGSVDNEEEAGLMIVMDEEDITEKVLDDLADQGGIVIEDLDKNMLRITRVMTEKALSMIEYASQDDFYGDPDDPEDNAKRVGYVLLRVLDPQGQISTDIQVGAGEDFQLRLDYLIENGPPYPVASGGTISLFSAQDIVKENCFINLKVPADLVIKDLAAPEPDPDDPDNTVIYTMPVTKTTGDGLILNAYFKGNGGAAGIRYGLTDQDAAEIVGQFTIEEEDGSRTFLFCDKGDPGSEENPKDPVDYAWTLTTYDNWTVYKENTNANHKGEPVTMEDGTEAIRFDYDITVGLGEENSKPTNGDDIYFHYGRAGFDSYELTDTLVFWEKQEGGGYEEREDITPIKVVLKPGDESLAEAANDGEAWAESEIPGGSEIRTGQYAVKGYTNTSGTGLDTTDPTAPYYTRYKVEAYYDKKHFELQFYDSRVPDEDAFRVRNTAAVSYQLKGGAADAPSSAADGYYQYVRDRGQIDLSKFLEIPVMVNGSLATEDILYSKDMPEKLQEEYGGTVTFGIERWDDGSGAYQPYDDAQILVDGKYEKLETISIDSSSGEGKLTFFVDPGTYRLTETGCPDKLEPSSRMTTQGDDADGGKRAYIQDIVVVKDSPEPVTFYNAVNSGGVRFEKKGYVFENHRLNPDKEVPVAGAVFEVYDAGGTPSGQAASGEDGTVEFFPLDPGEYTMREISAPEGYIPDDTVYNVTVEKGKITAPKDGTAEAKVLYNQPNQDAVTVQKYIDTDPSRAAAESVERLTSDQYGAYIGQFKEAFRVQYTNDASVTEDTLWTDCAAAAGGETRYSLDDSGSFVCDLPVYYGGRAQGAESAEPTWYRVVEEIPAGFTSRDYDAVIYSQTAGRLDDAPVVMSAPFQVRQPGTSQEQKNIAIVNILRGGIHLNKSSVGYEAAEGGDKAALTYTAREGAKFYLLKEVNGAYEQAGSAVTDAEGKLSIANLDVWDSQGQKIRYYWYEAPAQGEKLEVYAASTAPGTPENMDCVKSIGPITVDGVTMENAEAAGPFELNAGGGTTAYAYNAVQKVPMWFIKEARSEGVGAIFGEKAIVWSESDTDTQFRFRVYRENPQSPGQWDPYLEADNKHTPYFLETGAVYRVIEYSHPDRYMDYTKENGPVMTVDDGSGVPREYVYQELDLLNREAVTTGSQEIKNSASDNRITFVNEQKQKFRIDKTIFVSGAGTDGRLKAETYHPTITMVLYKAVDRADGGGKRADTGEGRGISVTTQTDVWVEPGEYFIAEPNVPDGCVNPAFYLDPGDHRNDTENPYYIDHKGTPAKADDVVYYGPYSIDKGLSDRDQALKVAIANYKAAGSIEVTKIDTSKAESQDGGLLNGAAIGLYKKAETGSPALYEPVKNPGTGKDYTIVTGSAGMGKGKAVFENLPIYDEDGGRIIYILKENKAPDGYDLDRSRFETELNPGGVTVIADRITPNQGTAAGSQEVREQDQPITFRDNPLGTIVVRKFWYDKWDSQFNYDYARNELPGVRLALFKVELAKDGADTAKAVFVESQVTNAGDASVTFSRLDRRNGYFVIEMENPEIRDYILPDNKVALTGSIDELKSMELVVNVSVNGDTVTYDLAAGPEGSYNYAAFQPQKDTDVQVTQPGEILNERPWVQINLTKYADRELSQKQSEWTQLEDYPSDSGSYYYKEIEPPEKVNGAQFELYEIPAESVGTDLGVITDEAVDNGTLGRLVDTYETGTKLDGAGGRLDGEFMTAILRASNVYYLREVKPAPGNEILDRPQRFVFVPGDVESYQSADGLTIIKYQLNGKTDAEAFNYKWTEGEGPGQPHTAYVKLNKWLREDIVKEDGSTETSGYKPLGGVTFELRIEGKTFAAMETGLDNEWEDDTTVTGQAMSKMLRFEEIAAQLTDEQREKYVVDSEATKSITFDLVEVKAPDRVKAEKESYPITVTFDGGINQQYFWEEDREDSVRLVNTLMNGYQAQVNVFGYVPTDEMFEDSEQQSYPGITDEYLENLSGLNAAPLKGVEMELYRYDYLQKKYVKYNYNGKTFKLQPTDERGTFVFSDGLPEGKYYLTETKIPYQVDNGGGGQTDQYYTMYTDSGDLQKRFTVRPNQDNVVNLYNPELPALEVTKKTLSGAQDVDLEGLTFKLKSQDTSTSRVPVDETRVLKADETKAIFRGIYPNAKFSLTESVKKNSPASQNVSVEYQDLLNSQTFALGYRRLYDADTETVYLNLHDGSLSLTSGGVTGTDGDESHKDYMAEFTMVNPRKASLTLTKVDAQATPETNPETKPVEPGLSGAKFARFYLPFAADDFETSEDGAKTVRYPSGMITDEALLEKLKNLPWDDAYEGITGPTGEDGTLTLDGLDPGWYRLIEDTAPDGYSQDYEGGYPRMYYVAVTADLGKDHEYAGQIDDVLIPNWKKADLKITKELAYGSLTDRQETPEFVIFQLYKGVSPNQARTTGMFATITDVQFIPGSDGVTAGTAYIRGIPQLTAEEQSQGVKYYLEEQKLGGWQLTGARSSTGAAAGQDDTVSQNGTATGFAELAIDPETGRITLPVIATGDEVDVTVTNLHSRAEIVIKKVEAGNETKSLDGAEFALYSSRTDDGSLPPDTARVPGVTAVNIGDGVYTFKNIPVTKPEGDTYYLYEVKAPATHYVRRTEPVVVTVKGGDRLTWDSQPEGTVNPGEAGTMEGSGETVGNPLLITNESGVDISLVKYPDVYGSGADILKGGSDDVKQVKFDLFVRDTSDGNGAWTKVGETKAPDPETGKMTWTGLKLADREYAVSEQEIREGRYKNYTLDGLYLGGARREHTEEYNGRTLYLLSNGGDIQAGGEVEFQAYNKPAVQIRIQKKNMEGFNRPAPEAVFRVWERIGTDDGSGGQWAIAEDNIRTNAVGGKDYTEAVIQLKDGEYKLEEIESAAGYNLIPDDERLVTSRVIRVPDQASENVYEFTNIQVKPELAVKKTVTGVNGAPVAEGDTPMVENLWWNDNQTVKYQMTPELWDENIPEGGNFAAIREFRVTDTGLVMRGENEAKEAYDLDYDIYTRDNYSFTGITIPGPSHESHVVIDAGDGAALFPAGPVTAELTLYGFNDSPIGGPLVHEFTDGQSWRPELPADARIKYFEIQYYDASLRTASEGNYSLAQNFRPGTIEAEATLYRQSYRPDANAVISVVRNQLTCTADYAIYDGKGVYGKRQISRPAYADVNVLLPDTPTIEIGLGVENQNDPEGKRGAKVDIDDTLTYTMNLENVSQEGTESKMVWPILVNRFPKGVVPDVQSVRVYVEDQETEDAEARIVNSDDGYTYLMITLKGTVLERGQKVKAQADANVTSAIINNGSSQDIRNMLYVSSGQVYNPFGLNPGGASFRWSQKDAEGKGESVRWPDYSSQSGTDLIDALVKENNLYNGNQNGYAHTFCQNEFTTGGSVTLLKEGSGNLDTPGLFVSEPVGAKISSTDGAIRYHLTVKNTSGSQMQITNLRILDMLPRKSGKEDFNGANRASQWLMKLDTSVEPVAYRTDKEGNRTEIPIKARYYLDDENNLKKNVLEKYSEPTENGWNSGESWEKAVDAVGVMFDIELPETEGLKSDESVMVEFGGKTPDWKEGELDQYSYTYDTNSFSMTYEYKQNASPNAPKERPLTPKTSNLVSVTLQPGRTGVGGRIWIDANGNGIQDDEKYEAETTIRSDLGKLLDSGYFDVKLDWKNREGKQEYSGSVSAEKGTMPDKPEGSAKQTGVIDSDGRFLFSGLLSSKPISGGVYTPAEPADEHNTIWNQLIPERLLKPYTYYQIQIATADQMPEGMEGMTLRKTWTTMTEDGNVNRDSGQSRKPSTMSQDYGAELKDSNFIGVNETENQSESFFLWMDDIWDRTKDFGVIPYRDLALSKKDENGAPLMGAQFALYGPFDSTDEAKAFVPPEAGASHDKLVKRAQTDEEGRLTFEGILYYLPYVLAEEGTPEDYMFKGATASAGSYNIEPRTLDPEDASWILGYGARDVAVTNQFGTGALKVTKADSVNGKALAGAQFELTARETNVEGAWDALLLKAEEEAGPLEWEGVDSVTVHNGAVRFTLTGQNDGSGVSDGTAVLGELPYGTYILTEIKAPDGYILGDEPWNRAFTINQSDRTISFTTPEMALEQDGQGAVGNEPHHIRVVKIQENDPATRLAGAGFILKSQTRGYVLLENGSFAGYTQEEAGASRFKTDANGEFIILRLPADVYQMVETSAPSGYYINNSIPTITTDGDKSLTVQVGDQKIVYGGGSGGGGGGGGGTTGRRSVTTILPDEVPLAALPGSPVGETTILDEEVPLAGLPKTGQIVNRAAGFIALLSTALMGVYITMQKKKRPD